MPKFQGSIFDVDGVLVDSPHEKASRESLRELMESSWRSIRDRTTWSPDAFTSHVKTIDHPEVGPITLDCDVLTVAGSDLRLVVYTAEPSSPDANRLRLVQVIGLQKLSVRDRPT